MVGFFSVFRRLGRNLTSNSKSTLDGVFLLTWDRLVQKKHGMSMPTKSRKSQFNSNLYCLLHNIHPLFHHNEVEMKWMLLYPMQRVAEGIMFLTRPSVSQSVSPISPVFLVSATPLRPLNRIAWNFVVMKDIMCRYAFLHADLILLRNILYPLFCPIALH